jgi:hypothetical protein
MGKRVIPLEFDRFRDPLIYGKSLSLLKICA